MALTKCPDCGTDVSTEAPACPKCGRPSSPPKKKTSPAAAGCGLILLAAIIIGIIASASGGGSDHSSPSSAAAPKPKKHINLKSAAALDDEYDIPATSACDVYADDYLRQAAKYDFKWDDVGFLDTKFDKYVKTVAAPGVLTMVSDKIALQNGFGAYQHVELYCEYDTQADKVVRYWIVQ